MKSKALFACRMEVTTVRKNLPKKSEKVVDVTGLEGKWILEVKGKIVASSDRVDEILRRAQEYPLKDVMVTKVPYPGVSCY